MKVKNSIFFVKSIILLSLLISMNNIVMSNIIFNGNNQNEDNIIQFFPDEYYLEKFEK